MDTADVAEVIFSSIRRYRVHILVFFVVLFIGLTFAHPELLLTDEWITVNQLHQLHDGHQVLMNEGKYGWYENGTPNAYFAARGNRLAYSLFLPLISLPALWLVDLFGNHFAFFILYLWTFILLLIILSLHFIFREYSYIGRWRWTTAATGAVFLLFFINLFYYTGFSVNNPRSYPEITAIVFTNILLLALAGVLIYEINRTLFSDTGFCIFGTVACLTSSSFFFWATGCKDHILTMVLFTGILLCLVRFQKTREIWYLPLAFLITGLLAWARPELAIWVFLFTGIAWGYLLMEQYRKKHETPTLLLVCSPFFTALGALPFFLNNYLVTKNPLMPPNAMYIASGTPALAMNTTAGIRQQGDLPGASLTQILTMKSAVPSTDIAGDIFGILFHPLSGNMGLLTLTPIFVVMALLAVVFILTRRLQFSGDEFRPVILLVFMTVPVFLAYANNLPQLNMSMGITPDIRYLSPAYIPLNILGFILLSKMQVLRGNPVSWLVKMAVISAVGIPIAVFCTAKAYADPAVSAGLTGPLSDAFTLCIWLLVFVSVILLAWKGFSGGHGRMAGTIIALLCAVPFIWQIDVSVIYWLFTATGNGYAPWIPVTHMLFTVFASPLLVH